MAAAERPGWVEVRSQRAVYTVQSGSYLTCLPVVRRACALVGVICYRQEHRKENHMKVEIKIGE